MADGTNPVASALDGIAVPGRFGRSTSTPGVRVSEVRGAGLATVTARKGRRDGLLHAARHALGIELPTMPRRTQANAIAAMWSGPDQWLVSVNPTPKDGMEALLARPLAGLASVVDQSHGRTLMRIAGPRVRAVLAKGVPIDLHARSFRLGDVAMTLVAHIPVHLWQIDETPTYEFAVTRSLTKSFWHWLAASAAEYGLEFLDR